MSIVWRGYPVGNGSNVAVQEASMFGRSSTRHREDTVAHGDGRHADDGHTHADDGHTHAGGHVDTTHDDRPADGRTDPVLAQEARREKFGGLNLGAAFFGWLVAIAVSLLLTGIIGAIAAAVGSDAEITQSEASRQGLGVWVIGLLVTIVMVALGAVFGQQYDVLSRVNLPRLPVSADTLSTGGIIAAIAVLLGTLLAAIAGGSVGTHYHRRVDKVGWKA